MSFSQFSNTYSTLPRVVGVVKQNGIITSNAWSGHWILILKHKVNFPIPFLVRSYQKSGNGSLHLINIPSQKWFTLWFHYNWIYSILFLAMCGVWMIESYVFRSVTQSFHTLSRIHIHQIHCITQNQIFPSKHCHTWKCKVQSEFLTNIAKKPIKVK